MQRRHPMHRQFRSIWISDTHLGGKNLRSEELYQFLQATESEYLYLVGDIVDFLKLKRHWYWPEINNRIIKLILEKAGNGTKVFYLPGNHDDHLRTYCGKTINNISFVSEIVHTSVCGDRFLVMHGDKFDCVVQNNRWLTDIGSILYEGLLKANHVYNRIRMARGRSYISISAWLKQQCKLAVNYIGNFEDTLYTEIKNKQVDGIICGHIHHAAIRNLDRYLYSNCGDWVENCTALAENRHGTIGIIEWSRQQPDQLSAPDKSHEQNSLGDRCLAPTN